MASLTDSIDSIEPVYTPRSLPPKFRGSPGTSLKRAHPSNELSLPSINPDLTLEVFTHSSIHHAPNEEFGDGSRLAALGETVIQMIVTWSLFSKHPLLSADEIVKQRKEHLSDAIIDSWLSRYRLREKLRFSSDAVKTLNSPEEGRILMNSYVGAVFYQHGLPKCHDWISRLTEPDSTPHPLPSGDSESDRLKRLKLDHSGFSPSPPAMAPPLHGLSLPALPSSPGTNSTGSPASSAGSLPGITGAVFAPTPAPSYQPAQPAPPPPGGMAYLPMFNQFANQRRVTVDYPATFAGPPHAGRWSVKCMVNGVQKGEGFAASKQLAKEEAARQAYFAMGWNARPGSATFPPPPPPPPAQSPPPTPGAPAVKQEDVDMNTPPAYAPPPQPAGTPPPAPPSMPPGPPPGMPSGVPPPMNHPLPANPMAPSVVPGVAFLPMFNQTATQRRLAVDYPAEFSGPPHAGRWIVKCVVNGIVKGYGQGASKQLAKEEAAKQAYYAMGWANRI